MKNKIEISKERKIILIEDIKEYFYNERGDEIGDLAAELFFDFIVDKIGPELYNQGLIDAKKFVEEKTEDIYEIMK